MHYPIIQKLDSARKIKTLGCRNKFGKLRLYNVDLLPTQSYFYFFDSFQLLLLLELYIFLKVNIFANIQCSISISLYRLYVKTLL